jgi:hypothetical protein
MQLSCQYLCLYGNLFFCDIAGKVKAESNIPRLLECINISD